MEHEVYLTVKEVAEHYRIGKSTVWRFVNEGRLPKGVKIAPGTTRWRLSDIRAMDSEILRREIDPAIN